MKHFVISRNRRKKAYFLFLQMSLKQQNTNDKGSFCFLISQSYVKQKFNFLSYDFGIQNFLNHAEKDLNLLHSMNEILIL